MAAGFKIRKVRSEQSIGDKLKRARNRRKLSISEVEEGTKVRAKFLLSLESDCWEEIPSEVYGRGYLERYLTFLGLPVEAIMRQYDRERQTYARHCRDAKVELAPKADFVLPRFLLTPRLFVSASVLIFTIGLTGVVTLQLRQFVSVPFIQLATPAPSTGSGDYIVKDDKLTLSGRTTAGANVVVNGHLAQVDPSTGAFSIQLPLKPGGNEVHVVATNHQNRMNEQSLWVVSQ